MSELNTDVRALGGIGERRAQLLGALGVTDLGSLLSYFPRRYEDRTALRTIDTLISGEFACVRAMVATAPRNQHIRRGLDLLKVRVVDGTAALELTFFNQPYLQDSLHIGETYTFYGRAEGTLLRRQMTNPVFEKEGVGELVGCIVPIYPLSAGLTQKAVRSAVRQGLAECADLLEDCLDDALRQRYQLCRIGYAYKTIHEPPSFEELSIASRRLVFEELYVLSLGLRLLRDRRADVSGAPCAECDMAPFYRALPFSLTDAQQRAVDDILRDLRLGRPMNRLCQGDVGSGKTMVAAAAAYFVIQSGWQCALMAPTEILAAQHYEHLCALFAPLGIRCGLLKGSMGVKARRETLWQIASGEVDLVIGTHALISADVAYHSLGLVITDEQHRFGVHQRAELSEKGQHPHMLVMSATPIPRTLALILYGDLDISVIDQLPPGRRKIDTFAVASAYHERIYSFIRKEVAAGHQAYIVCSMVSENDEMPDERKAVTEYSHFLQKDVFPDLHIGAVHGKMKNEEKEAVMSAFALGKIDVLVSTTVIEVGVDVSNATVILIENAERFGLSQLHQLRGRVGRGKAQSYCILVSDDQGEECRARLSTMCRTGDGFRIAEEDLRLRGPGDFFGARQHGLPGLKVADLSCDMQLLSQAQEAAGDLLASDPTLQNHPLLRKRVDLLFQVNSAALN